MRHLFAALGRIFVKVNNIIFYISVFIKSFLDEINMYVNMEKILRVCFSIF